MKLLAVDSSGLVASVAVITEEALLAEYTVNYKKTHSQTLLPMLNEITAMIELDLSEIDGIAVVAGPGSFTGLRIGSATVKGLGMALSKPIIPVPTVDSLAYNLYGTDKIICPMMDARRNQVYTGLYEFTGDNQFHILSEQKAVSVEEIIREINGYGREVIFLGDGVSVYKEMIMEKTKVKFTFAPPHMNRQRAGAVGALGLIYYKENKLETASEHEPVYLRLSQAERERNERLS
ncbi:tRNA (adenosine(37)-N6)-threonylcarbamoyltransferase complex dimerization subunit type 1 TsaB [Mobilitalea sibirica]|uniref:tRNA (Adenosine(37)-N6)-threonylcarbamoyltransferase complex dimerization subunit type 1 TsaB n=1 Tax=Mobilitalea sibirica TaxID=1462919 RepID=A0A8J7H593_9FIRM|nr:tRNA (adenosine(37)-N6)-threonylcarbamoyltransferase complex dimerization subunit type 1 TsaB [Mobilitalea sibirica]MBH1942422.1 tRNA (adenosine(37)-N6)-threonylcarbamoyltransferase complex dimerization subunit type 1 TsaB [Mobilitalea sibirica]